MRTMLRIKVKSDIRISKKRKQKTRYHYRSTVHVHHPDLKVQCFFFLLFFKFNNNCCSFRAHQHLAPFSPSTKKYRNNLCSSNLIAWTTLSNICYYIGPKSRSVSHFENNRLYILVYLFLIHCPRDPHAIW